MAENLDDLLPFHHLFDVAVDGAQVFLLGHKITGGAVGDLPGDQQHQPHHEQRQASEGDVQGDHGEQNAQNGHRRGHQLRHALADHLTEGVDVVGVDAHNVPVGMGIKIADGQSLHVAEQITAQAAQGALGHIHHDLVVSQGGQGARQEDQTHAHKLPEQRSEIGRALGEERSDIVVDQCLDEQVAHDHGGGTAQNEHKHQETLEFITLEQIGEQAAQHLPGMGHGRSFLHHGAFGHGAHSSSPPFCWER